MGTITPDSIWSLCSMSHLVGSPEGGYAAYFVYHTEKDTNTCVPELWIYSASDTSVKVIKNIGQPECMAFLNENVLMYSLSEGESGATLMLLHIPEMRKELMGTLPLHVCDACAMAEGVLFTAYTECKKNADGIHVVTEYPAWYEGTSGVTSGSRCVLYYYCRKTGETVPLTKDSFFVTGFHGQDDLYVYYGFDAPHDGCASTVQSSLYFGELSKAKSKRISCKGFQCAAATIIQTGQVIYCGNIDNGLERGVFPDFYTYDPANGKTTRLTKGIAVEVNQFVVLDTVRSQSVKLLPNGDGALFLGVSKNGKHVYRIDCDAMLKRLTDERGCVTDCCLVNGGLLVDMVTETLPEELYLFDAGRCTRISHHNAWAESCFTGHHERLVIKNQNGSSTEGFVLAPRELERGKKYPAVLHIHGGPNCVYADVFSLVNLCLINKGYYVIFLNPPGSSGWGSAYADICGHWGEVDYDCFMRFTDAALQAYPSIDENRLGVFGGSYGGFMTNWIISHTARFRAAVAERGISNWGSMSLASDIGGWFVSSQLQADLYNDQQVYWDRSPLKYARDIQTPLLLLHGTEDHRCHYTESMQLYSALKLLGAQARLVLFDGEDHSLPSAGKPRSRARYINEILEWFKKL